MMQNDVRSGNVIWITGLSGAGKSTLARELVRQLRENGKCVVAFDGDELRELFGAVKDTAANHGRDARLALAMRYAALCRSVAAQGVIVIISTISLFREVHTWNRSNLPGYFEVFLNVSIEELRRRDPKGIYRRYDAGELENVAGLDVSVDEPEASDYSASFIPEQTPADLAARVLAVFHERFRRDTESCTKPCA